MANVSIENRLNLYSNYLDDPQNVDIDYQMNVVMKINKYLSANVAFTNYIWRQPGSPSKRSLWIVELLWFLETKHDKNLKNLFENFRAFDLRFTVAEKVLLSGARLRRVPTFLYEQK
jgi:hypothetical protein